MSHFSLSSSTISLISSYEKGKKNPSIEVLTNISMELKFPFDFFYKHVEEQEVEPVYFFRSMSIPKKTKEMLYKKMEYFNSEILGFCNKYINLSKNNLIEVDKKDFFYDNLEESNLHGIVTYNIDNNWDEYNFVDLTFFDHTLKNIIVKVDLLKTLQIYGADDKEVSKESLVNMEDLRKEIQNEFIELSRTIGD